MPLFTLIVIFMAVLVRVDRLGVHDKPDALERLLEH